MAFVSKPENFKVPFFGNMIRKCCFLPIDRENPRNAVKTVDKAANLIKADEVSVGIYPEGTRNKSYVGLLPFHNSVFKIAHKANNAPIVIVGVSGTEKIHKNTPWKRTHVYLEVMRTLSTEEVQAMRTNEIGKITEENLMEFLQKHGHVRVETENATENSAEALPAADGVVAENENTVSA
jgi:1-acyl-sn-glycerol-3-phosphate acyltransferase